MKNKPYEMCLLFDFYGEILTKKQKDVFDLYYNEDLSLSEISLHYGITRQAVCDSISKGENALRNIESKLLLCEKHNIFIKEIDALQTILYDETIQNKEKVLQAITTFEKLKEQASGI